MNSKSSRFCGSRQAVRRRERKIPRHPPRLLQHLVTVKYSVPSIRNGLDSGDSNRDLHMLQVTRGAEFPMVTVRTRLPETAATSATVKADLEVQFAGQTAHYSQVPFELVKQGNETHLTGTIPATLADFKIDPPSLLTLPVKNEIPVRVEMTWTQQ